MFQRLFLSCQNLHGHNITLPKPTLSQKLLSILKSVGGGGGGSTFLLNCWPSKLQQKRPAGFRTRAFSPEGPWGGWSVRVQDSMFCCKTRLQPTPHVLPGSSALQATLPQKKSCRRQDFEAGAETTNGPQNYWGAWGILFSFIHFTSQPTYSCSRLLEPS